MTLQQEELEARRKKNLDARRGLQRNMWQVSKLESIKNNLEQKLRIMGKPERQ